MTRILYKEWRASVEGSDIWTNFFNANVSNSISSYVHKLLDLRFRNYYVDEEEFKENYIYTLMMYEYTFYNRLLKLIRDDGSLNVNDVLKSPHSHKIYSNESHSDSVGHQTGDNDSNTSGTGKSDSTGKTRGLLSDMPHSNVSSSTSGDIDMPIKWNYATSVNDGINKTDGNTSNTSQSSSNYVNDSNSTNDSTSKGSSEFWSDMSVDVLAVLDRIDFDEPFEWLCDKLLKCFSIFY